MLVWVYFDFWACSPFPVIHSLFILIVKHLIHLFRPPALSSASARAEILQRRQCQECLGERWVWEGRARHRDVAAGSAPGVSHTALQSWLLFRCVFINQFCCCLPTMGPVHPAFALTVRNKPEPCSSSNHMGCSQTAHKDFSLSCPMLREASSPIVLFPCISPCFLISSFLPCYIFLLSVIHWELFYCAFLFYKCLYSTVSIVLRSCLPAHGKTILVRVPMDFLLSIKYFQWVWTGTSHYFKWKHHN